MRESLKTLLTNEYIWNDIKSSKTDKYNGITALLGMPVILGFIPACWIWVENVSDIHTGAAFWIIVLAAYAIILPMTIIVCKKSDRWIHDRIKTSLDNKPIPPIVIGEDICIKVEEDRGDSDIHTISYILYFEKAGKIRNPSKHNLIASIVHAGDKFYTVSIPNTHEPLRFYSASAYRLRELTKEELTEEDRQYGETEQELLTTLVNLESHPKLQIRDVKPSWYNDIEYLIAEESDHDRPTLMRRLAVTRFDGDLISAAEYIVRYADPEMKEALTDIFDSLELLLYMQVFRELSKKRYK